MSAVTRYRGPKQARNGIGIKYKPKGQSILKKKIGSTSDE